MRRSEYCELIHLPGNPNGDRIGLADHLGSRYGIFIATKERRLSITLKRTRSDPGAGRPARFADGTRFLTSNSIERNTLDMTRDISERKTEIIFAFPHKFRQNA